VTFVARFTVRLVDSIHHGGLLYGRLEQAGLTIVTHDPGANVHEVEGDPAAVQAVVSAWDGEGRVEIAPARPWNYVGGSIAGRHRGSTATDIFMSSRRPSLRTGVLPR
jgi:hypothetical protein